LRTLEELKRHIILILGQDLSSNLPEIPKDIEACRIQHPSYSGFTYEPWLTQFQECVKRSVANKEQIIMVDSSIQRGQRVSLKDILPSRKFQLGANISSSGVVVDFSCFGLDSNGKLSDDRYMTFFNQPLTPCGGVEISHTTGDNIGFSIDLEKIPPNINSLMITAAIDGNGTMSQLSDGYVRFILNGKETTRFSFKGADFASEKALMLMEVYRKNDDWRICATGQGFNGGLDALVKHFGGAVTESLPAALPLTESKNIKPEQPKQKIILKKQGDTAKISLKKNEISTVHVRLSWTKAVDLDLHVFYKTKKGETGHIYFGEQGHLKKEPYVILDKDSGVGNTAGDNEENLRIGNMSHFSTLLIATNIFRFIGFLNSGDNFAKYDGKVTLKTDSGESIEVPLISEEKGLWCLIAKIDNTGDAPLVTNINKVQKEEPDEYSL
jgi:tellurite resistance protein TerA